jgi:hypothetical protein
LPYAATSFVCALSSLTGNPPCESKTRPTLPRPPHPVPTFVTMANAPLPKRDGGISTGDLGRLKTGMFSLRCLDRKI